LPANWELNKFIINVSKSNRNYKEDAKAQDIKRALTPLICALLLASLTATTNSQQLLEIVLYTNKSSYWLGDPVQVFGYLYYNGNRVSDGVISLEMDDPTGYALLFRTLNTGNFPTTETIEILSVFPSDQYGNQENSFERGSIAYFTSTVKNKGNTTITILHTLTVFDYTQGIMDTTRVEISDLLPQTIGTFTLPMYIPDNAPMGTAIVYANTFTNLPRLNGTALSIEKSATFTIIASTIATQFQASQATIQAGAQFFTNFTVPLYQHYGNYNITATCKYLNETAVAKKRIEIRVPDLNGDDKVNVLDLIVVAGQIGWTGPPGDVAADVNRDGAVNVLDLIIVAKYLGWTSPPP